MRATPIVFYALALAGLLCAAAPNAASQPSALRPQTDQTQRAISEEQRSATKPLRQKAAREHNPAQEEAPPRPQFGTSAPPPANPHSAK